MCCCVDLLIKLGRMDNLAFEIFRARDVGHFRLATGTDGGNDALEAAVGRVVNDPSALVILIYFFDFKVESCTLVKLVELPEMANLLDNLRLVRVSLLPVDGWMEAIHEGVNLKSRGAVHALCVMKYY